jgi:[1-hydroxy-2-(trimethylamino)ethyl]phosphonate dioxygenase
MDHAALIDAIDDLFRRKGTSLYGGEAVTQTEHALQAAMLAENSGASPAQIAAALLHDVGHLLHDLPDDVADSGTDDEHEQLGYEWLCEHFPPEVTEPVRRHVEAKRYLCAVDETYLSTLSSASLISLCLQGGPMTDDEVRSFEAQPLFDQSLELRRWDDQAKVPGLNTPDLRHFLGYLSHVALRESGVEASL